MDDLIQQEQRDAVVEIQLNRPEKKNALTLLMYRQLSERLKAADENPKVNVILLTGAGDSFSAGNDIGDFVASVDDPQSVKVIIHFLHTLAAMKKPVIAAIQGDAVGIGTTLLLHCDLVIAADNLRCLMPFVRMGLLPEGGSTLLFPRMIGHQSAFELMVEGSAFGAARGREIGLINQVVGLDELKEVARSRAQALADLPIESVKASKQLMKKDYLEQLHSVMDEEGELFYQSLFSREARQAFSAFLHKNR